ncbi:MAG: antiviral reverse transcriptase Drt3b [Candidatus Accumulibacter sp. UW26]|jgi:hypothetical protein
MKRILIKRNDYNRVLLTETLPFETPIIFSNDGLYEQVNSLEQASDIQKTIIQELVLGEGQSKIPSTVPYRYKIRKNTQEYRRLSLLHPYSQWKIRKFYEKYEQLILHYCSVSPASIRTPRQVAGSYYHMSTWENINKYKNGSVAIDKLDRYVKHTPSYFSYHGYDRLYKFFNSRDYFSLEKQFSVLVTLDVSKCFDSIYTHCLSWAVKDKAFTKTNFDISTTFGQAFDHVIRHGNHNETNGIPIGPEVSRIFAEILFQKIDRQAIKALETRVFGVDYAFRRYVDDVFIFARDDNTARLVYDIYSDLLISFNLHANTAKSTIIRRPFLTSKSRLIFEAGRQANDFFDKFLLQRVVGTLAPKPIYSYWNLTKSYIDSVKSLCSSSGAKYDDVASFLISVITERIKRLVNCVPRDNDASDHSAFAGAIEVLLDVLFFLYSVAPSVGASYKLSTSLILALRFSKLNLPDHSATIAQRIYDHSAALFFEQLGVSHAPGIDGFVHLEYLNIVLAIRELGSAHLLPPEVIDKLFIRGKQLTYFTIISCLFYVRDDKMYDDIRKALLKSAREKLSNMSDILGNSEKTYLLLDLLPCPFVSNAQKKLWIKSLYKMLQKPQPSSADLCAFLGAASKTHAQIDWADVDLLNSLEKKELKQAY